jgi:hypothetical protein
MTSGNSPQETCCSRLTRCTPPRLVNHRGDNLPRYRRSFVKLGDESGYQDHKVLGLFERKTEETTGSIFD